MTTKHIAVDVYGRVQGVGFRYTTLSYAQKFDLVGSVANRSDGSVHIEAQGTAENLSKFLHIIKSGPSHFAHVDHVQVQERPLENYSQFSIS
ncbi:acylphosphatase [Bombilactobacillus mellis]|uniref:acylphosphatase n=1 Tax=Bombilactobacillus mellis TaxID=1218508 RepID=UPI001580F3C3|nr:acylphosphatase [Bombilactobacillus mellis]NUF25722.1 acylphosphatase [Bombilactobacillus mellis]